MEKKIRIISCNTSFAYLSRHLFRTFRCMWPDTYYYRYPFGPFIDKTPEELTRLRLPYVFIEDATIQLTFHEMSQHIHKVFSQV